MPLPASRAAPPPAKRVDFKVLEFKQCSDAVGFGDDAPKAVAHADEPRPWNAIKPPQAPDDWLHQFKEEGQSFSQWLELCKNSTESLLHTQNKGRNVVYLLPDPNISSALLETLRSLLEAFLYPLKVQKLPVFSGWTLLTHKLYPFSGQQHYNTDDLFHARGVQDQLKAHPDLLALILLTKADMYTVENKEERVELGMSVPASRFGCVSLARLHPSFFARQSPCLSKAAVKTNTSLFLSRAIKLMSHQVFSVLLIRRCIFFSCAMNGANFQELDSRPLFLCPVDLHKYLTVLEAIGGQDADEMALKRYQTIKNTFAPIIERQHIEYAWLEKRIAHLSKMGTEPSPAAKSSRKARATFLNTSSDEVKVAPPTAVDLSKWVIGKTVRIDESYTMGTPIGTPGQFGQAFLVKHKNTGETRVVKVVSKQKFHSDKSRTDHYEQLRNEIAIMRKAKHANIIHFFEVFESAANLYIVMECCSGGELFDHIQARGLYSEQDATVVLRQIIEGIKYLHDQRIAHCDLKPDNFLFVNKDPAAKLKIIDFGMSKHVERGTFLTKFRGTPYYVAPEVLSGKYSEHCDIWSFGVVMFVCLFGYPPFHANNNNEIFDKIEAGFQNVTKPGYGSWFPASIPCSADAKDLIAKCLTTDIARRLTAQEVLEHKWFNGGASTERIMDVVLKNLHNFVTSNQFKMEVLALMVDVMGKDELKGLAQMFAEIDINGDGLITPDELVIAFKKQGIDDEKVLTKVKELMKSADTDGDGALSYNELLLASVQKKLAAKEERLWQAFCKFDKDLDGTITEDEIAQVLNISPAEAKALILEVDANGDGVVDYEEFSKMMIAKEEAALGDVKAAPTKKPASSSSASTSSTLTVPK